MRTQGGGGNVMPSPPRTTAAPTPAPAAAAAARLLLLLLPSPLCCFCSDTPRWSATCMAHVHNMVLRLMIDAAGCGVPSLPCPGACLPALPETWLPTLQWYYRGVGTRRESGAGAGAGGGHRFCGVAAPAVGCQESHRPGHEPVTGMARQPPATRGRDIGLSIAGPPPRQGNYKESMWNTQRISLKQTSVDEEGVVHKELATAVTNSSKIAPVNLEMSFALNNWRKDWIVLLAPLPVTKVLQDPPETHKAK
jgi:hypothetical protein